MKKTYNIGPHTQHGIAGHVTLEVTDFVSGDKNFQHKLHGISQDRGPSINQLKEHFGGKIQGPIGNPFYRNSFTLDLSPWLHLDGERRLEISWIFAPAHSVSPNDLKDLHPFQA